MEIINKILVKQIITEKSKEKLFKRFNNEKMQLEQEHQQLLFEQRKLQNQLGLSKREVSERFQIEYDKRKRKIAMIDVKVDQLAKLPICSEIVEKEVEALVEVRVGSNWDKLMKEKTIIVKDGIVIRIENR